MWQLVAGFTAVLLVLSAAIGLARYPRPIMGIVLGLLLAIPTAGLVAYAAIPGPSPELDSRSELAFIPVLAGLGAGVWMLVWMRRRRAALTLSSVERLSNGAVVMWAGVVVGVSDLLSLFEPGFAIANLVLNAAWVLLWVPRPLRRLTSERSVEIKAPRTKVFAFVAEPSNWPLYVEDLVSVTVRPQRPLATGSVISQVQRYQSGIRGPRLLPEMIETTLVVSLVIPGELIRQQVADRPSNETAFEFADSDGGTRITTRASAVVPFRLAVFGAILATRSQRSARRAKAERTLARLKALLEPPPPAR